jgi:hypothetical protein
LLTINDHHTVHRDHTAFKNTRLSYILPESKLTF